MEKFSLGNECLIHEGIKKKLFSSPESFHREIPFNTITDLSKGYVYGEEKESTEILVNVGDEEIFINNSNTDNLDLIYTTLLEYMKANHENFEEKVVVE
jgi:hypothetical protein